jgi:20S proteasome subunit beta 4
VTLYGIRNDGVQLEPKAVASFSRRTIAENLRTSTPYNVNLLIGGVNSEGQAELYWIDYLGSCVKVPFACHGYAGYFCMGLLDRNYKSNMSKPEALELLKKCIQELKVRFVGNLPAFTVHIYNAGGNVEELTF